MSYKTDKGGGICSGDAPSEVHAHPRIFTPPENGWGGMGRRRTAREFGVNSVAHGNGNPGLTPEDERWP